MVEVPVAPVKNPVGKNITAEMLKWTNKVLAAIPRVPLYLNSHPSPWGSIEYSMTNGGRDLRIWINDYRGQGFIEIKYGLEDTGHRQKFYYFIDNEVAMMWDIATFFTSRQLPPRSEALEQYIAWQNSEERQAIKKSVAEQLAAPPPPPPKKEQRAAFSTGQLEQKNDWKDALAQLTNLGNAHRAKGAA